MHRHRLLTVAVAAAALAACTPSIEKHGNPESTDYVLLDPSTGQIPLPNDLALQNAASQTGAQGELLQSFAAQGGFPNDQEVPITIDVQHYAYAGDTTTKSPPPTAVDPATTVLNAPGAATIALFEKKAGAATPTPVDPNTVTVTYVPSADKGTITIQNKPHAVTLSPGNVIQSRRWNAGSQYIVLLRGGASGVKLQGGAPLTQQPTMYFLTRGVDLSKPENQYLLPGDGRQGRAQTGAQLEQLRKSYLPLFGLAEQVFGAGATKDLLSAQTFQIAPQKPGAAVVTDASAGIVPLPSDLLLDPTTNKVVKNPAFCGGQVDPKTGSCPIADGLATLDGFSTTAMILSQTSAPVAVATITRDTVFLYDLSNPAQPTRVKEFRENAAAAGAGTGFVAEPYQITYKADGTSCSTLPAPDPSCVVSPAIGLQPAVPVPLGATGPFATLPPLKEATEYAVLVTDGVKDTTGSALQSSTLSRLLLFENALVDANGKSQVAGQSDATAAGLEKIRQGVAAAAAALQAEKGIGKSHIVLGYTFRTQTISTPALQLAAAPYQQAAKFVPGARVDVTSTVKALATSLSIPTTEVQAFWQVPFFTKNPIDPATGALEPDATKWTDASLTALVALPAPKQGAPLVVFQHGLGGDKTNMVAIANTLTTAGFVVAAIDAPLHGDRSYCVADSECVCPEGGTGCSPKCNLFPSGAQGDTVSGTCSTGSVPEGPTATPGTPISGRFFVSANLFRTRDALRQNLLDVSALVLAVAPTTAASNPFATALTAAGVSIDPTKVYWVGQSLGGILGTLNAAANPRFSEAVLNVPGGTLTDVFTQSPTFGPRLPAILGPLGITPGTPQYLQFLQVAKLILDAGDPINFAGHLVGDAAHPTLPDLLGNKPNQVAKKILVQVASGDTVIPNPFNYEEAGNIFTSPQPDLTQAKSNVCTYTGSGDVTKAHGFLLDPTWSLSATTFGQQDAAAFLLDPVNNLPPATR